jgi:hypothetical protein
VQRRARRAPDDRLAQGFIGFYHADATAQSPPSMDGYKNAAPFAKKAIVGNLFRELTPGYNVNNGTPS